MPKVHGVSHRSAVRAVRKARVVVTCEEGKYIVMTDGTRIVTVPRHNPVTAYTMGGIVHGAGLDSETFRKLL